MNIKKKFVRCCLIYKNPKEYYKRIIHDLIYYSLVLQEKFVKNNKSNNINIFCFLNQKNEKQKCCLILKNSKKILQKNNR